MVVIFAKLNTSMINLFSKKAEPIKCLKEHLKMTIKLYRSPKMTCCGPKSVAIVSMIKSRLRIDIIWKKIYYYYRHICIFEMITQAIIIYFGIRRW